MAKSAMIRARTEQSLKHDVEKIFSALGLTFSEAINLFLHQVKLRKGIPFDIEIPNKETLKAIKDSYDKKKLIKAANAVDLSRKLGI